MNTEKINKSVARWLEVWREYSGPDKSVVGFCRSVGLTPSRYYNYVKGRALIPLTDFLSIASISGVPLPEALGSWLEPQLGPDDPLLKELKAEKVIRDRVGSVENTPWYESDRLRTGRELRIARMTAWRQIVDHVGLSSRATLLDDLFRRAGFISDDVLQLWEKSLLQASSVKLISFRAITRNLDYELNQFYPNFKSFVESPCPTEILYPRTGTNRDDMAKLRELLTKDLGEEKVKAGVRFREISPEEYLVLVDTLEAPAGASIYEVEVSGVFPSLQPGTRVIVGVKYNIGGQFSTLALPEESVSMRNVLVEFGGPVGEG